MLVHHKYQMVLFGWSTGGGSGVASNLRFSWYFFRSESVKSVSQIYNESAISFFYGKRSLDPPVRDQPDKGDQDINTLG